MDVKLLVNQQVDVVVRSEIGIDTVVKIYEIELRVVNYGKLREVLPLLVVSISVILGMEDSINR